MRIQKWDKHGEKAYQLRPEFCHSGIIVRVLQNRYNSKKWKVVLNDTARTRSVHEPNYKNGREREWSLATAKERAEYFSRDHRYLKACGVEVAEIEEEEYAREKAEEAYILLSKMEDEEAA